MQHEFRLCFVTCSSLKDFQLMIKNEWARDSVQKERTVKDCNILNEVLVYQSCFIACFIVSLIMCTVEADLRNSTLLLYVL